MKKKKINENCPSSSFINIAINFSQLDNWYEECLSLVQNGEFSSKLSSWLFDIVRRKMEMVNFNENENKNENENENES